MSKKVEKSKRSRKPKPVENTRRIEASRKPPAKTTRITKQKLRVMKSKIKEVKPKRSDDELAPPRSVPLGERRLAETDSTATNPGMNAYMRKYKLQQNSELKIPLEENFPITVDDFLRVYELESLPLETQKKLTEALAKIYNATQGDEELIIEEGNTILLLAKSDGFNMPKEALGRLIEIKLRQI